jgi:hypothetical protein
MRDLLLNRNVTQQSSASQFQLVSCVDDQEMMDLVTVILSILRYCHIEHRPGRVVSCLQTFAQSMQDLVITTPSAGNRHYAVGRHVVERRVHGRNSVSDSANHIELPYSPSAWLSKLARDTVVLQKVSTSGRPIVIGSVSTSTGDLLHWKPIGVGCMESLSHHQRPHDAHRLQFIWQYLEMLEAGVIHVLVLLGDKDVTDREICRISLTLEEYGRQPVALFDTRNIEGLPCSQQPREA